MHSNGSCGRSQKARSYRRECCSQKEPSEIIVWFTWEEPGGTILSSWLPFTDRVLPRPFSGSSGRSQEVCSFFINSVHRRKLLLSCFASGARKQEARFFSILCSQKEPSEIIFELRREEPAGTCLFFKFCLQKNHSRFCLDATHLRQ